MSFPMQIRFRKNIPLLICSALFAVAGWIMFTSRGFYYTPDTGLIIAHLLRLMIYTSMPLFLSAFEIRLNDWLGRAARLLFLPCAALVCLWQWENMGALSMFRLDKLMLVVNYALMLMLFLPFHLLLGDVRRSVPTAFCVLMFCGYAYHCVMLFRGTPLLPMDITSFGTAMAVAGTYKYPFDTVHYLSLSLCASMWLASRALPKRKTLCLPELLERLASLGAIVAALYVLVAYPILSNLGVSTSQWPESTVTTVQNCGSLAQFFTQLYGMRNPKPAGYDTAKLEKLMLDAPEPQRLINQPLESTPNVIVIMNESLANLTDALGVMTDTDAMPFIHSLEENTIKGDLFVSVRGGGTSNTEYEFLTGNALYANSSSMAFYQIVKRTMPSIAHLLKQQGYTTLAMHPERGDNYHRNEVYSYLGFDEFWDITAFADGERFRKSFTYTSDRTCYEKIKSVYEQKQSDERLFIFNVTMQNHSPYTEGGTEATVNLTQEATNAAQLNEYLRCVKESDAAFEELIAYFSLASEPTIILMFGDHQPGLNYDGIKGTTGEKSESKTLLDHYITPYVIWANYDIAEMQGPEISANYLYSLLLSCTNLDMGAFEAFQLQMMERCPIITRFGFTDENGHYEVFEPFPDLPETLLNIYGISYNRAYDVSKRLSLYEAFPYVWNTP